MPHPIAHIEFSANSYTEAAKFYQAVFDWQIQEIPEMNYATFATGEGVGGGFNPVSAENPAGTMMVYIETDSLEESLAKVEANGGKVLLRSFEISGVGWMATFQDPTGNTVSLLKLMPMSD